MRRFVEKTVVACGKCVVHDNLHARFREPTELVEISERIQESRGPPIAAASALRRLGKPNRLTGRSAVAKLSIEGECPIGAREPLFRQSRFGSVLACTTLRQRSVVMVGNSVDAAGRA